MVVSLLCELSVCIASSMVLVIESSPVIKVLSVVWNDSVSDCNRSLPLSSEAIAVSFEEDSIVLAGELPPVVGALFDLEDAEKRECRLCLVEKSDRYLEHILSFLGLAS